MAIFNSYVKLPEGKQEFSSKNHPAMGYPHWTKTHGVDRRFTVVRSTRGEGTA